MPSSNSARSPLALLGFCLASFVAREAGHAQQPPNENPLARQARGILEQRCFQCHGMSANGRMQDRGGFGSVLDTRGLVQRQLVTPGAPERSVLLQKIVNGEMPPRGERVPEAEVATLRQWIASMAATSTLDLSRRAHITEAEIVRAIQGDLLAMPELDRAFARYFTLHTAYNQAIDDGSRVDEIPRLRDALTVLLNSLSWQRTLHAPHALLGGALVRVDLRRLGWDARTWATLVEQYPYGHATLETQASLAAAMALQPTTRMAWVRADWFVHAASRPPLYDTLLRLPENDAGLERLLMIDAATDRERYMVMRAGFVQSGVSQNNRVIERHESPFGAYWRSFDFEDNTGAHNVLARPLGPGVGAHEFTPSGGEIIFNLPNGLQAYMLVDGQGRRIPEAPTRIVHDTTNRGDPTVRNGVSCISCHGMDGLKEKGDEVSAALSHGNFPDFVRVRARGWYVSPDRMRQALREDSERYLAALRDLVPGVEAAYANAGLPVATASRQHESPLTLTAAAAELDATPAQLAARIRRSEGPLGRVLGPLLTPAQTLPRDAFACSFRELARELDPGVSFVPLATVLSTACGGGATVGVAPARPVTVTSLPAVTAPTTGCRSERVQVGSFPTTAQGTGPTQVQACERARQSLPASATTLCTSRGATADPVSALTCQCTFRSSLNTGAWNCSVRGTVGCFRVSQVCR